MADTIDVSAIQTYTDEDALIVVQAAIVEVARFGKSQTIRGRELVRADLPADLPALIELRNDLEARISTAQQGPHHILRPATPGNVGILRRAGHALDEGIYAFFPGLGNRRIKARLREYAPWHCHS